MQVGPGVAEAEDRAGQEVLHAAERAEVARAVRIQLAKRDLVAEDAYRVAWNSYVLTKDESRKRALEVVMDALQEKIATGPKDERWVEFRKTLVGFDEFWSSWTNDFLGRMQKLPPQEPDPALKTTKPKSA